MSPAAQDAGDLRGCDRTGAQNVLQVVQPEHRSPGLTDPVDDGGHHVLRDALLARHEQLVIRESGAHRLEGRPRLACGGVSHQQHELAPAEPLTEIGVDIPRHVDRHPVAHPWPGLEAPRRGRSGGVDSQGQRIPHLTYSRHPA
ncbi:hypothetical protein JOL79_25705 [Microbispora sp. RL4-1S]|uniref:Uncharacterized protein n=1 Tax=Microbispora oryzae TaxID=2806554 RepID=A0A941AK75_9ACTN|nr:hypothetical protein [Microbispora oryzae]MBP2707185.1 hypothetical protein [Microbispora oryzae]